jgi:hypothetical protein
MVARAVVWRAGLVECADRRGRGAVRGPARGGHPAAGLTPAAVGDSSRVVYLHDDVVLANGDASARESLSPGRVNLVWR